MQAKVKLYQLEDEVIDLYKHGLRGHAIATRLNLKHKLGGEKPPLSKSNVDNFIKGVPSDILASVQREHQDAIYMSTRRELMEHIHTLQTDLFPQLQQAIEDGKDMNTVRTYGQLYMSVFKEVSSLEGLAGQESIMRAEHHSVMKQLSEVLEFFKRISGIVCTDCQTLILKEAQKEKKILITRDTSIKIVSEP